MFTLLGSESAASTDQQPHKRSRGAALFAAALAIAVVSAGIGGVAALDLYSPLAARSTVATVPAASSQPASTRTDSIEQVAAKVVPSVVKLQTDLGSKSELGSGIILSPDGLIMTNAHVVSATQQPAPADPGGVRTMVTFADGRTAPFTVVATDPTCDIAVVRADGSSGSPRSPSARQPTFASASRSSRWVRRWVSTAQSQRASSALWTGHCRLLPIPPTRPRRSTPSRPTPRSTPATQAGLW